MEKDNIVQIPYVAHESSMNRMERANKRLWIVIIIMFLSFMLYLLLPTEVIKDVDTTQTVDNIDNSEVNQSIGD